jgi:hypothetical protein
VPIGTVETVPLALLRDRVRRTDGVGVARTPLLRRVSRFHKLTQTAECSSSRSRRTARRSRRPAEATSCLADADAITSLDDVRRLTEDRIGRGAILGVREAPSGSISR